MAGVSSMSRETLSNQPFSIRNMKTFRRFCRALWASDLSRLASSGWYLDLNLCPELGSTKKWGGNDGGWDERDVKVREQMHIIYLCCNCGVIQWHREIWCICMLKFLFTTFSTNKIFISCLLGKLKVPNSVSEIEASIQTIIIKIVMSLCSLVLVSGLSVYAGFDFVIIVANYCSLLESLRLTHQKNKEKNTTERL